MAASQRDGWIGCAYALVFGLAVSPWLVAVVLAGRHLLHWLQFGDWPIYRMGDFLNDMGMMPQPTAWVGINKLVQRYLDQYATMGLVWTGMACLFFLFFLAWASYKE